MRVVKFPEFIKELQENKNLIYSELHDYMIDGLYEGFRMEGNNHDYILTDLLDSVTTLDDNDEKEYWEIIDESVENGKEFKIDLECTGRDGMFDYNRKYVIYDKDDIKRLVDKLSSYLK